MKGLKSKLDPIWWWRLLSKFPGGKWLYSKGLGRIVRYTGTINPKIELIDSPGFAHTYIRNTRHVRNHVGTVHAAALLNLVELTATLSLLSKEGDFDCMVKELSCKYLKPARGKWVDATCMTASLELEKESTAKVNLYSGRIKIAEGYCTWRIWKNEAN